MSRRGRWVSALAMAGTLVFSLGSMAAPTAIVEDSSLSEPGIMDYLDQGRVLTLKPADKIILGYLNSCIREEIQGGSVTIGATESTAVGSKIKRSVIPCGGTAQLSQTQSGKSGAFVVRQAPGKNKNAASAEPSLTVLSLTPVLRPAIANGALKLQRLDQPGEAVTLPETGPATDLKVLGIHLVPGGIYRASTGQRNVVFRVDPAAKEGGGPLLSRLVHF